jgi:hypothetical protein
MRLNLNRAAGVSAVVLGLLAPMAGPAAAFTPPALWVKAGAPPAEAEAAYDACFKDAQEITGTDAIALYPRGPVTVNVPAGASQATQARYAAAGAAGAALGAFLVIAAEQQAAAANRRAKAIPRCMHVKGYHQMAITAQEDADLHGQGAPEKRAAWLERFYARPDFNQRLTDAVRLPTRLPAVSEGRPPSTVFGSLQFDPSKLYAPSGEVKGDGAVLAGPVGHWRTATLKTDVTLKGVKDGVVHAGAPLQLAALDDAAWPYWCTAEADNHVCLRMEGDYYVSILAKGPSWAAVSMARNASESGDIDDADIALTEGAADAVGPVDFTLEMRNLTNKSVSLVAIGRRGGEQHQFWRNDLDFDAKGEASLRIWNYRLVLTRTKGGVTARYAPQPRVN